jgi:hypothetical protein
MLVKIVVVQTGFRIKFAFPSDASARVGEGKAARGGAGAVGNTGGARTAAGRRPATCPAPAQHSPPRLILTRLQGYVSRIYKTYETQTKQTA